MTTAQDTLRVVWHLLPVIVVCTIMFGGAYAAFRERD